MKKELIIEGMMCEHCKAHVKEALEALGLEVEVNLSEKKATVVGTNINDNDVKEAIENAGYELNEIINID